MCKKSSMRKMRRMEGLGVTLALSLCTTVALLILEGRPLDAIPLHLCSLSALAALFLPFGAHALLLDFLWYLGIPGALLALIFPAPALSRWQTLLNLSYTATHALIVILPCAAMVRGARPRRGRAPQMMILLQGLALLAFAVNRRLGTDFMFLMAPPAGTPLERVYAWGYFPYLLALEGIMLAVSVLMGALLAAAERTGSRAKRFAGGSGRGLFF